MSALRGAQCDGAIGLGQRGIDLGQRDQVAGHRRSVATTAGATAPSSSTGRSAVSHMVSTVPHTAARASATDTACATRSGCSRPGSVTATSPSNSAKLPSWVA